MSIHTQTQVLANTVVVEGVSATAGASVAVPGRVGEAGPNVAPGHRLILTEDKCKLKIELGNRLTLAEDKRKLR